MEKGCENVKNRDTVVSLTLKYIRNKDLFDKVNNRFIKKGYDAVEDINDPDTDMLIIVFDF